MGDDAFLSFLRRSHGMLGRRADPALAATKFRVCIGNEAGDPDSHVTALGMAYLEHMEAGGGGDAAGTVEHVGMSPVPRADFSLQLDRHHLLKRAGLDGAGEGLAWAPAHMHFADEVDLPALHAGGRLSICLTDHNELCAALAPLGDCVDRIVDHHQDKGRHAHVAGARRAVAFGVGSCSSQVAQLLYDSPASMPMPPSLAQLLLGTILLDTVNLQPDKKPQQEWERGVAERLAGDAGVATQAFFDELITAKSGPEAAAQMLRGFSNAMFLRQDYKCEKVAGKAVGAASVAAVTLEQLVLRDPAAWAADLSAALSAGLDVLVVATMSAARGRQLCVVFADAAQQPAALAHLNAGGLQLAENAECAAALKAAPAAAASMVCYDQGNAKASRKVILPLLADAQTGFVTKM